jgi:hypothetical protein
MSGAFSFIISNGFFIFPHRLLDFFCRLSFQCFRLSVCASLWKMSHKAIEIPIEAIK